MIERSAGVLDQRTMMVVFGGQGQNSNRLKSDHFAPPYGSLNPHRSPYLEPYLLRNRL